ncbi:unnamed protein product, partial [Closterium sp. NIES-54]
MGHGQAEVARMREQFKSRAKELEQQAKAAGDDAAHHLLSTPPFFSSLRTPISPVLPTPPCLSLPVFPTHPPRAPPGISATLDVHLSYIDIMRPFAEAVLCAYAPISTLPSLSYLLLLTFPSYPCASNPFCFDSSSSALVVALAPPHSSSLALFSLYSSTCPSLHTCKLLATFLSTPFSPSLLCRLSPSLPLPISPSLPLTMHHPLPPSDHLIGPQRLLSPSPDWVRGVCASPSLHRKLCALLAQLLQQGRLVGVQVCAYMGGEVVVDVAAGFLGRYDPRAVQHDSLFSVFSATKGVTSGIMHWLAHNRRVQLEGRVADIWPGFEGKGKHQVTVADVLTHRAGLPNAMSTKLMLDPMLMCRWQEMLSHLAAETPESPPGTVEEYHYLSFGWLAGGIIE